MIFAVQSETAYAPVISAGVDAEWPFPKEPPFTQEQASAPRVSALRLLAQLLKQLIVVD